MTGAPRTTSEISTNGQAAAVDAGMVFLCGFPGGGTDLLMSILNAHRAVFIPGEFPFLARLGDQYGAAIPAEELDELVAAFRGVDVYKTFRNHHWVNFQHDRKDSVELPPSPLPEAGEYRLSTIYQWLLGVPQGIAWTGNKTPSNTEHIDRLTRMFPEARFIIVTRDVRDVVLTWSRKWGKDPLLTAWKYNRRMTLGLEHARRLHAGRTHVVRFERILDDLEGESRQLCDFLDLSWDPEMLRFHEHVSKRIPGKPNWGAPLISGNYGKWKRDMSEQMVRRIEQVAFPAMTALKYPPTVAQEARSLTRLEWARGRLRDLYATLAVDNRYQRTNRRSSHFKNVLLNVRKFTTQRSIRR